ncbi:MAG: hypothetical protein JXP73_03305 [Deltaproteobacteria bacterium]|nr:hypothetical protein [Deltaproteobacteria bacterium]
MIPAASPYLECLELGQRFTAALEAYGRECNLKEYRGAAVVIRAIVNVVSALRSRVEKPWIIPARERAVEVCWKVAAGTASDDEKAELARWATTSPELLAREIEKMPTAAAELEARRRKYVAAAKRNPRTHELAARGEETRRRVLELYAASQLPQRERAAAIARRLRISSRLVRSYLKRK